MNTSQAYILISIISLAVILVIFILMKKKTQNLLSPFGGLAFAFVIAGIFFGESRLIGYGLMGAGITIAIVDIIKKSKKSSI